MMEEDENIKGEIDITSDPKFAPAKRNDDIGILAWRLCGQVPDFTAAVHLADAIEAEIGSAVAAAFKAKVIDLIRFSPPSGSDMAHLNAEMRRGLVDQFRRSLRTSFSQFLYDFNSVCGALALVVSKASEPVAPLSTRSASVDLVYFRLPGGYGSGYRVRMPDGRQGVVVVPAGANGEAGVMPSENSSPMTGSGSVGMAEDSGDADPAAGY